MRRLLLLTALALAVSVAQASDGSFYFGAGVTSNHVNLDPQQGFASALPDSMSGSSWQAFAGIRPIRLLAFEADYLDLGSQTNSLQTPQSCVSNGVCALTRRSDAKAFAGYAVGFLPIPLPYLDIYGKAGVASYKLNDTTTYYFGTGSPVYSTPSPGNGTAFTWGAGVQAHIGIFGGRIEYEGFSKASTSVFSLSVFLNLW